MSKKLKKPLSWLLTVCMTISMLCGAGMFPTVALASSTVDSAINIGTFYQIYSSNDFSPTGDYPLYSKGSITFGDDTTAVDRGVPQLWPQHSNFTTPNAGTYKNIIVQGENGVVDVDVTSSGNELIVTFTKLKEGSATVTIDLTFQFTTTGIYGGTTSYGNLYLKYDINGGSGGGTTKPEFDEGNLDHFLDDYDRALVVQCLDNRTHSINFSPLTDEHGGYTIGEVVPYSGGEYDADGYLIPATTYTWKCVVDIHENYFVERLNAYVIDENLQWGSHVLNSEKTGDLKIQYYYNQKMDSWDWVEYAPLYVYVNHGVPEPTAPDYGTLKDLLKDGAVKIDCTNTQVEHGEGNDPITYGLIENSYTPGSVISDNQGGYTYTITVHPDLYVEQYNTTNPGHTLKQAGQTGTITLKKATGSSEWTVDETTVPVTFQVECETPEVPARDWDDIYLKIAIYDNETKRHIQSLSVRASNFEPFRDTVTFADPVYHTDTGKWTMDVTVDGYVDNEESEPFTHVVNYLLRSANKDGWGLAPEQEDPQTITLTYKDRHGWYDENGDTAEMIFYVAPKGNEPGTDPAITDFAKDLMTSQPGDVQLDIPEGVIVTYPTGTPVEIPADGSVTLMYKLTVTGKGGANFTITDQGATLVGSNCQATSSGTTITGTIPEGGTAILYVIKTFTADDIDGSNVTNTASIATTTDGGVADGKDEATENTPAEEGKPSTPGDGDLPESLKTNAVTVHCTNSSAAHNDATYGLITGGYDAEVIGNKDTGWQYVITIDPEAYAKHYDTQEGYTNGTHTAATGPYPTITLLWNRTEKEWQLQTTLPVTVQVECKVTSTPEKPEDDKIPDILGAENAVVVECVNTSSGHNPITYDLWKNGADGQRYSVSEPQNTNGTWTCDVTILPTVYVNAYNGHYGTEHWLDPNTQTGVTITLTWNEKDNVWEHPTKTESYWAKFTVSCGPDAPTDDEVITALGENKSILVDCINSADSHGDKVYTLWKNSDAPAANRYEIANPAYADGKWTCVITILPEVYVDRYNEQIGVTHWLADDTPQEVVLTLDSNGTWTADPLPDGSYRATFKVLCAPSDAELANLLNGKVTVDCTTAEEAVHASATYGLIENGYTRSAEVTTSADGSLQYVVTIDASAYAAHYDEDKGHTDGTHNAATTSNPTITLTWDKTENQWSVGDGITIPVTCTPGYTLTYDANGGTFGSSQSQITVPNINPNTEYTLDGQVPTKSGAVFIGWTTDTAAVNKVYGAGQQLPALVEKITMTGSTTVYAAWGEDTNGDGTADAQQIIITPADITVYAGGDSYNGVVGENGSITSESSGIPEPGYYFTLPYELNQTLQELTGNQGGPVNLANHIRLTDITSNGSRQWILQLYDGTTNSAAYGKYIYRLAETATGNSPAKLVIKDGNTIITDDALQITNEALYQEYTMSLDTGAAEAGNITVEISADGRTWSSPDAGTVEGLCLGEGTLIVRGTDNSTPTLTTAIGNNQDDVITNDEIANLESQTTITAVAPAGTSYTINGSDVSVIGGDIRLLTDGLLPNTVLEAHLDDAGLISNTSKVDYQYLDLVDVSNGNTYVTTNTDLDIYWKLPADADPNGTFHVVHFNGLDRNYNVANLENLIGDPNHSVTVYSKEKGNLEIVTLEDGEQYLKFATRTFSPFALVYDAKPDEPAADTVTVTFKSGSHGYFAYGYTYHTVELDKGSKLSAWQIPAVYTDENYTFIGWYKEGAPYRLYTSADLSGMTIWTNTTFIAQYQYAGDPSVGNKYGVIYDANFNGGSYPRREGSYDVGAEVTVSENKWFERDGYIFVSWNTKADGTGNSYAPGDTFRMPSSDVYLYAQWQQAKPGPDDTGVSRWLETKNHYAYLAGYPDSTFGADRNMTRAEVAQMFYSLLTDKDVTVTASFSDVSSDAWYATAVNTMASLGMMNGYPDGTFHPDAPITRAEFATVALAFAYEPGNASCPYLDVNPDAWYYTYVAQAATYGWIGGYPDGTFRPNNSITRAEVCVIVNNMLGRTPDEDYISRNKNKLVNFVDLSDRYWGYYTIMEATNSHEYTGNHISETWNNVK